MQALQQLYKDAQMGGADVPLFFEDDRVVLDIPMEGVTKGHWSLVPVGCPMVSTFMSYLSTAYYNHTKSNGPLIWYQLLYPKPMTDLADRVGYVCVFVSVCMCACLSQKEKD